MRAVLIAVFATGCSVISGDLLAGLGAGSGTDASTDSGPGPGSGTPVTDGLVLDYEFDDCSGTVATDATAGHHDGIITGATTIWSGSGGRHGCDITMTPVNPATAYVTVPAGVFTNVSDFTIGAWVRMTSNPSWARIYDLGGNANGFMYLSTNGYAVGTTTDIGLDADWYFASSSADSFVGTSTALPTGVWKHVAITGKGSTGERHIYIDGYPVAELASSQPISPSQYEPLGDSWIGRSRFDAAGDPGFPGEIDELKIYNQILTPDEIADLAWPQSDYHDWRFDEAGGDTAADSSDFGSTAPASFTATLSNGATFAVDLGILGNALDFTGGDSGTSSPYAEIPGNPLASCDASNQFTIAAWIRIHAFATNSHVFDFGGSGTDIYFAPSNGTSQLAVGLTSPGGKLTITHSPIDADDSWHHVAVTMDATSNVSLYLDGAQVQVQSTAAKASDFAGTRDHAGVPRQVARQRSVFRRLARRAAHRVPRLHPRRDQEPRPQMKSPPPPRSSSRRAASRPRRGPTATPDGIDAPVPHRRRARRRRDAAARRRCPCRCTIRRSSPRTASPTCSRPATACRCAARPISRRGAPTARCSQRSRRGSRRPIRATG